MIHNLCPVSVVISRRSQALLVSIFALYGSPGNIISQIDVIPMNYWKLMIGACAVASDTESPIAVAQSTRPPLVTTASPSEHCACMKQFGVYCSLWLLVAGLK